MSTNIDGFKEVECPFCSAKYRVPETVYYSTCPYCGTTFKMDSPDEEIAHYLFKLMYDDASAYKKAKTFASLMVGAVKDLDVKASYKGAMLYYIPTYIYEIRVRAICSGVSKVVEGEDSKYISIGGGEDAKYYNIPATDNLPIPIPEGYRYPARMKEYFKPSILKSGVYIQPSLNPMEYFQSLKRRSIDEAMYEARISCPTGKIELIDESKYIGIHHYPFWDIKYEYNGGVYRAVVDGTDGTIVYLEYPIDLKRGIPASISLILSDIAVGVLTGIAVEIANPSSFLTVFITGSLMFTPGVIYGLRKLLGRREIYRYNPKEEESFLPIR